MKLLKKLIEGVENEPEQHQDKVLLGTVEPTTPLKPKTLEISQFSIKVIVCEPSSEAISVARHFAMNFNAKRICYLGFGPHQVKPSLATSLYNIQEVKYLQVKSLMEFEKVIDNQVIVISAESAKWLESLMFLRRSLEKLSVFIAGTQKHFLKEQKILSKYRDNFSGAIMKKDKGTEKRYSARLLEKKLEGIPLVFLSDGVIKAERKEADFLEAA